MHEKILDGKNYGGPGIVGRLSLIILCLYLMVFGSYSYWQINDWTEQYQITQIRSSERILAELESQIRLRSEADAVFYSQLFRRHANRSQFIRLVKFRHRNGQVYKYESSITYKRAPKFVEDYLKVKEDPLDSVVKKSDIVLGHLSLQLKSSYIPSQVWDSWVKVAVPVTSITAFLIFIMFVVLASNVKVLRSVISLGDNISEGNYKVRIEEIGSAEARAASQTINQLATLMENMSFSTNQNIKSLMSEIKRVEDDSVESDKLRETAEYANQTKSDYLSNVSEEFRTPLSSIMSLSEMMMKPEYQAQQKHFSEMIHASAIHLQNYINNVLDIAQLESEELIIKKSIFDFRSIFREVNEMAMPYAAQHKKSFNMMLDNDIPYYVICDAPRLKQLMLSTICDVIANGEQSTVFMKCHILQSNVLSLSVQFDVYANSSQTNMSEDFDWTKITEAQADNRVCDLYGKAGVGLPIARKVVSALSGSLEEKSYEQQDHSFKFTLPLERPSETRVMEHEKELVLASEQKASRRTLRVLLAESHLINRYVYELVFFHRGHVTVKIDNGNDALKELQQGEFDFAILDQQMPGMSGAEVAKRWREQEKSAKSDSILPILIVTSDAKQETITECQIYADLVEIKPVSPYALINQVEHYIDNPVSQVEKIEALPVLASKIESKSHLQKKVRAESALKIDDLLDLKAVNQLKDAKSQKINRKISDFYTLFETELMNLENALVAGDQNAYKLVSTRMTNDSSKVGARALRDQFIQLNQMDSHFVLENSKNVIEAITQVYSDTRQAYKKHLQSND